MDLLEETPETLELSKDLIYKNILPPQYIKPLLFGDPIINQLEFYPQIYEIFGSSGTGKTCFALQLSLRVVSPAENGGLDGQALYISTNGRFCIKRLQQLTNDYSLFDKIHVLHTRNSHVLLHLLKYIIPPFVKKHNIKLLVIDSVAPNFRHEEQDLFSRSELIQSTGLALHQLRIMVLLINEVK
ncbi:DNA repair protein xrcc3, partial [Terramyces sp. JEL0728]